MSPKLKGWVVSFANAAISGVAASVGSLAAGLTLKQGAIVVTISTAMSLIKWLAQHPIPGGSDTQ